MTWLEQAECRGLPTSIFFPIRGAPSSQAKEICARCTVRAECIAWALPREGIGVWGGLSENQRRRVRSTKGIQLQRPERDAVKWWIAEIRHEEAS